MFFYFENVKDFFSLGLSYAGNPKEDILEAITPVILDEKQPIDVSQET